MALSKEQRVGIRRMGYDPDDGFISWEDFKPKLKKLIKEQENKAKEAKNVSASKKKQV